MKLNYYCSSCKKVNAIKVKSNNRFDLKRELGSEDFKDRCKHCGNITKRHINRLHSEPNRYMLLVGFLVAVVVTVLLWDLGFISTLSAAIPIAIWVSENKRASAFNKVMLDK